MKLLRLALAAIVLASTSHVFAAPLALVQYLTGSSSSALNIMKAARNLCSAANNGPEQGYYSYFNVYKLDKSTNALGNIVTGVCTYSYGNQTGSAILPGALLGSSNYTTVAINVSGGSASAVTATSTHTSTRTEFLLPVADCVPITGTEALDSASGAFGPYTLYVCPSASDAGKRPDPAIDRDLQFSDGGFMDVEGPVFPSTVLDPATYNAGDFKLSGFSQVFGVGVNSTLYNALQVAQGLSSTCQNDTTVKYTAACQPNLTKAQIASLINSSKTSYAKTAGGKFLVGGTIDTTQIVYCMRPQTSGAQQGAQLYFLNYGGTGSVGGAESIINGGAAYNATSGTAKFVATLNGSSTDVKACLNSQTTVAGTGSAYRFGLLSFENNPLPALGRTGTDTYRFVRLNGVVGVPGTSNEDSFNTATALTGEYDYVFETVAYCENRTCPTVVAAILSNLSTALPVGSSTAGLFLGKGVESRYSRSSGTTPSATSPYIVRY